MIIHEIHDLSNKYVIDLMEAELSKIIDPDIVKNYNPDYRSTPGNLFYILDEGRYKVNKGKYYVVESNGQYICSAGWNEYELELSTVLMLTRMYTAPKYRSRYIVGKNILPTALNEVRNYNKVWMTVNKHNKMIYNWFERDRQELNSSTGSVWPEIYKSFKPIGKHKIYFVDQWVVEYK
jgi:hypothetical protein